MDLYQRVDEAVQRGEAWRAKEILRGNIASGSYDSQLYERYGRLLMELGELVEAGKYLFLSGRRSAEYERAIDVYLSRHPADRPDVLYHSFPSAARFGEHQLSRYPLEVRRTLQERGLPEYFEELNRQRLERHRQRKRVFERAHEQVLLREGWAGPSSVFRYGPGSFRRYHDIAGHPHPVERVIRLLGVGLAGAVSIFLMAATVVGVGAIVRWAASLL